MKATPVICYFCNERIKRMSFDVVFGINAFFLCNTCFQFMDDFISDNSEGHHDE